MVARPGDLGATTGSVDVSARLGAAQHRPLTAPGREGYLCAVSAPDSPFSLSTRNAAERIRQHDPKVNVFVRTRLEDAEREANQLRDEAARSLLHGVPYSIKDQFDTRCMPTTGGSWRYRNRQPTTDSPICSALQDAGAVLLGKSNLSDMGLPPEASSYVGGTTRNPFDRTRTAGGSSGGSAAAVAYGFSAFEWGADIGGSIRLPAAFCGVLGLRLSQETWPIQGMFPHAPPSLDWMCGQGPFTRTIEQMRAVLATVAPRMRAGAGRPFELKGMVVCPPDRGRWPTFAQDVQPHLRRVLDADAPVTGAFPPSAKMREIYAGVWGSHFEEIMAMEPEVTFGAGLRAALSALVFRGRLGNKFFHPTTAELLLLVALGSRLFRDRAKCLARAQEVRLTFQQLWDEGFIVAMPVTAYPPPKIYRSNWSTHLINWTIPGNMADATGLSIPFGTFDGTLPRSVQLLGPPGSEEVLLELGEKLIASRERDPSLRQPLPWIDR